MSYPVKIGNAEVVVASLDEAVELIAKYNQFVTRPAPPANRNGHAQAGHGDLEQFVAGLSEGPRRGLQVIIENGGYGDSLVAASLLCREMNLPNNMALTGRVLTPLTRRAHTVGIPTDRILVSERTRTPEGRAETAYGIPEESLEAIRRGLGM
jgi:hypothetical protein